MRRIKIPNLLTAGIGSEQYMHAGGPEDNIRSKIVLYLSFFIIQKPSTDHIKLGSFVYFTYEIFNTK